MLKNYRRHSSQSMIDQGVDGADEAILDEQEGVQSFGLNWRPTPRTAPPTGANTPYRTNANSRVNLNNLSEDAEEDNGPITLQVPNPSDSRPRRRTQPPTSRWQEALIPRAETLPTAPTNPAQLKFTCTGANAKFKSVVLKVIALNRMRLLSDEEPGVQDPSSDAAAAVYGQIKEKCSISVVDFGPTYASFVDLSSGGAAALEDYIKIKTPEENEYGPGAERPLWSKVRWINIGGVSWDVIKCLALRYHLHPLAIEDVLHSRQTYSSRADYYQKHLFIRVLCHTLVDENAPISSPPSYEESEGHDHSHEAATTDDTLIYSTPSCSQCTVIDAEKEVGVAKSPAFTTELLEVRRAVRTRARKYSHHLASMFENNIRPGHRGSAAQVAVNELKRGERVGVRLRNLYIALFRDGTLITIHQDPHTTFFQPMLTRLRQRDSLLRSSGDASLLLQHILDLVVDSAVNIVDRYHEQILKFERDILVKPKVSTVKYLHIASGDLTMHKRTLAPLKTLVYGLRRYDLDRVMALRPGVHAQRHYEEGAQGVKVAGGQVVMGFMSPKSKIYLADVLDHVEYILASLEMFESITENLIAYTFNVVSYDMNTTMRTLTIATVTFFPPTLLTGYFGMNFPDLAPLESRGHRFFWILAVPVVILIVLIFSAPRLSDVMDSLKKKQLLKTIIKSRADERIHNAARRGKCQCGADK